MLEETLPLGLCLKFASLNTGPKYRYFGNVQSAAPRPDVGRSQSFERWPRPSVSGLHALLRGRGMLGKLGQRPSSFRQGSGVGIVYNANRYDRQMAVLFGVINCSYHVDQGNKSKGSFGGIYIACMVRAIDDHQGLQVIAGPDVAALRPKSLCQISLRIRHQSTKPIVSPDAENALGRQVATGRRRLLAGGIAAAPIFYATSALSAKSDPHVVRERVTTASPLAQTALNSPSGTFSGNVSSPGDVVDVPAQVRLPIIGPRM